jgi:signal peptidase II
MTPHNKLRLSLLALLVLALLVFDQATKYAARAYLMGAEPILLLNGLARLQYAENSGAFLSLGAGLPPAAQFWIFTALVPIVLGGLVYFVVKSTHHVTNPMAIAIALLVAGGVGNLIDRLLNEGRVIDFMVVGYGWLRTGIFNVADMAIMAGVILLALSSLKADKSRSA